MDDTFDNSRLLSDDIHEMFLKIIDEFSTRSGIYNYINARLDISAGEYQMHFMVTPHN